MLEEKLIGLLKQEQSRLAEEAFRFPQQDKYQFNVGKFHGLEQALEFINQLLNEEDERNL